MTWYAGIAGDAQVDGQEAALVGLVAEGGAARVELGGEVGVREAVDAKVVPPPRYSFQHPNRRLHVVLHSSIRIVSLISIINSFN